MKKVISLLIIVFAINSCDDGNLIQENISFEDVETVESCTNGIIYKLKDQEALIVDIPATTFTNETTTKTLDINTTNRVVYRFYNGTVSTDNICATIPPATPIVTDQWSASDGQIVVTTTPIKETNATTNGTKITGYNHNITFNNVTFAKSNGNQTYPTFPFGNYTTTATTLPFLFDQTLDKCSTSNQVYNFTSSEAMQLNIDPSLIANQVTPLNTPRTGLITSTTNSLTYRLFSGGVLTNSYFCNAVTPTTPTVNQEWSAVTGVSDASGIIEVTTTTSGPNTFRHTIVLKKVTFKKGNDSFLLADSYSFGDLFTTN
ncbi:MAG: hypothetical protein KKD36_08025 [Bacteroidetes bacterium]|nr:hypothetical protein [Bacteroidota bacterium]